jgi:hypothetical protein
VEFAEVDTGAQGRVWGLALQNPTSQTDSPFYAVGDIPQSQTYFANASYDANGGAIWYGNIPWGAYAGGVAAAVNSLGQLIAFGFGSENGGTAFDFVSYRFNPDSDIDYSWASPSTPGYTLGAPGLQQTITLPVTATDPDTVNLTVGSTSTKSIQQFTGPIAATPGLLPTPSQPRSRPVMVSSGRTATSMLAATRPLVCRRRTPTLSFATIASAIRRLCRATATTPT